MEKTKIKTYTKAQKILYFLWLDEQIMGYWSQYVELKFSYGDDTKIPTEVNQKLDELLSVIDHFESYQDVLRRGLTYAEVNKFVRDNPELCKKYMYYSFLC